MTAAASYGHEPAEAAASGRVATLDGVRGAAILLVLGHHLMTHFRPAGTLDWAVYHIVFSGWCGVDLFFVLSGFLITGVLLDARDSERRYRNFYARRFLRIFPAHYAFLAVIFFVLPNLQATAGTPYAQAPSGAAWFWCYATNFRIAFIHPWPPNYLVPLWTLAIEEQFYLVWPLLVLNLERRTLMRVCVGLATVAFLLRVALLLAGAGYNVLYVLPVARMDTLALGSWAALLMRGEDGAARARRLGLRLAGCGAAVLLPVILYYGSFVSSQPGTETLGYSGLALLGTGVVLLAARARRGSVLQRFFAHPAMRQAGKYSYTLYLINLPVYFWVARAGLDPGHMSRVVGSNLGGFAVFGVVALATCAAIAVASWYLMEKHFLSLKRYFK